MKARVYCCGGSWRIISPSWVRAAYRDRSAVSVRDYYLGFRCTRMEVGP